MNWAKEKNKNKKKRGLGVGARELDSLQDRASYLITRFLDFCSCIHSTKWDPTTFGVGGRLMEGHVFYNFHIFFFFPCDVTCLSDCLSVCLFFLIDLYLGQDGT